MGSKFLPWPCSLPCNNTTKQHQLDIGEDDRFSSSHKTTHSIKSSSHSSANSSFSSQRSFPLIPSLTPSSNSISNTLRYENVATLKGHGSQVFSLAVAGKSLLSGGSNGEVLLWDQRLVFNSTNREVSPTVVVEGYSAVKSMVVLGDDDDKLITAHHDRKIRVWKIDPSHKSHINTSSLLPPPTHERRHHHYYKLVTTLPTLNDRSMSLLSTKNYVKIRRHKTSTWVHHADAVSSLTLSPDKSLLYSASWDRTLKIWRTTDFKCLESLQNAHEDAINSVIVSKKGTVFTGSADKTIKAWMRKNGAVRGCNKTKHTLVFTLEKHKSAVNALALSGDGSFLYSGACDRSIIVWRGFEREEEEGRGDEFRVTAIGALRGHSKAILCLAVVDEFLFSGSSDKTVRVWRRYFGASEGDASHCCMAVFEGHNGPIKCLSAAAAAASLNDVDDADDDDGRGRCYVVYSGSLDFNIKVWQFWV